MDNQTAFETAIKGIIAQGAFGYNPETDACRYYDPDTGNRCAVGLLFDLQDAIRIQDRHGNTNALGVLTYERPDIPRETGDMLLALQDQHDNLARKLNGEFDRTKVIEAMRVFADCHNLNTEFLDNAL